ncbi:ras gtpase-activating protein [Anaeramoeba ignava]|uniref:Ras gtpase-activating protein n=1 Tax=Anaeramoeba ignava TaxID=1746090 RepID=A0A9Q0R692_ANAIG|nr:ras gtpase-activating protein [Anaeramoeba ignava]
MNKNFELLINNPKIADIKFIIKQKIFDNQQKPPRILYAHKFLLATSSPIWYQQFYKGNWRKTIGKIEEIEISDVDFTVFYFILHFIYTQNTDFSQRDIAFLTQAVGVANKYQLKNLEKICSKKIAERINTENCLSLISNKELNQHEKFMKIAMDFIEENSAELFSHKPNSMDKLGMETIKKILLLESKESSEYDIYQRLIEWGKTQCEIANIHPDHDSIKKQVSIFGDLLNFEKMDIKELLEVKKDAYFPQITNVMLKNSQKELLSSDDRESLLKLVLSPELALVSVLVMTKRVFRVEEMETLGKNLLSIFEFKQKTLFFLEKVVEFELVGITDVTTLFRENSVSAKIIATALRAYGKEFLHRSIQPLFEIIDQEQKLSMNQGVSIEELLEYHDENIVNDNDQESQDEKDNTEKQSSKHKQKFESLDYEVYETNLTPNSNFERNKANLSKLVTTLMDNILRSVYYCPIILRKLCIFLKDKGAEKFSGANYILISGIIFLRFFSPGISAPERFFPERNYEISSKLRRGLILSSKIIQTVANFSSFPDESPMHIFNDLVEIYQPKISHYMDILLTPVYSVNLSSSFETQQFALEKGDEVVVLGPNPQNANNIVASFSSHHSKSQDLQDGLQNELDLFNFQIISDQIPKAVLDLNTRNTDILVETFPISERFFTVSLENVHKVICNQIIHQELFDTINKELKQTNSSELRSTLIRSFHLFQNI